MAGDKLNFNIFIKPTFGFVGQHAASEAGHITNAKVSSSPQQNEDNHLSRTNNTDSFWLYSKDWWERDSDNGLRSLFCI